MSSRRKNIADSDYRALLEYFERDGSPRALACLLLMYTGTRANEILRLSRDSIRIDCEGSRITSCSVFIKASKRGQDRSIELPEGLYDRMNALREVLQSVKMPIASLIVRDGTRLQSTIDSAYESVRLMMYNTQVKLFGERRYTLHSFRHTLAIRAIKEGYNIIQVKAILGHGNINSTYEYLKEYEQSLVLSGVHRLVKRSTA